MTGPLKQMMDEARADFVEVSHSPVVVTDPRIRKLLQLAGLRFAVTRARWFQDEATRIGLALKSDAMTSDQVDEKLEEMGALDLIYPELMVSP